MGMQIFDWNGFHEDGVIRSSDELTTALLPKTADAMRSVRDKLIELDWIEDDFIEWPLVCRRRLPQQSPPRRSPRTRHEMKESDYCRGVA